MRFFYVDPCLYDEVGQHANYCRCIVGELRSRGIETLVFEHHEAAQVLQMKLGNAPRFRAHTCTNSDGDPFVVGSPA